MVQYSSTVQLVQSSKDVEGTFPIGVGPRFLELFSENLYSSPNKAFEELVANSWDAGATCVYIHIPEAIGDPGATLWVLDNGSSMDFDGLRLLWTITSGHKREIEEPLRPQIGKFGIGKLATYILTSEVTYICRGSDGIIRAVPLNYGQIEEVKGVWEPDKVPLSVVKLSPDDLKSVLATIPGSEELQELIDAGVPEPTKPEEYLDEFGVPESPETKPGGTWTLVLLTSLKPAGRSLQSGRLTRMLRAALPLSSQMHIVLNEHMLESLKIDAEIEKHWILGRDLGEDYVEMEGEGEDPVRVTEHPDADPPYLEMEGLCEHSGTGGQSGSPRFWIGESKS